MWLTSRAKKHATLTLFLRLFLMVFFKFCSVSHSAAAEESTTRRPAPGDYLGRARHPRLAGRAWCAYRLFVRSFEARPAARWAGERVGATSREGETRERDRKKSAYRVSLGCQAARAAGVSCVCARLRAWEAGSRLRMLGCCALPFPAAWPGRQDALTPFPRA